MTLLHTAHLKVRVDALDAFRTRLLRHAETSLSREAGCLRFDVFEERAEPGLFLLVEVYSDENALEAHRASAHYLAFREDVKDWVAERRWWFWNPAVPSA